MTDTASPQLIKLSLMLLMEQRLRTAAPGELPFIMVNETLRIVRYRQAVLWQPQYAGSRQIRSVSGVAVPDVHSPFFQSLRAMLPQIQNQVRQTLPRNGSGPGPLDSITRLNIEDVSQTTHRHWQDHLPANALWCPLKGPSQDCPGILILFRSDPFVDADMKLMTHLTGAFGHALAFENIKHGRTLGIRHRFKKIAWACLVFGCLAALFLLPIRQSAMGSAEIVPVNPTVVRAPLAGVIKTFHKPPNALVKTGQPILELDDVQLQSQLDIAEKQLQIIKTEHLQAQQMAFTDPRAKADIRVLNESIKQRKADVTYLKTLLKRTVVHAPHDGILIFEDADDWIGRPVAVGEKIMLLANPEDIELKISMPVKEAIELHDNAAVDFFLNIAPTHPLHARIRLINYSTHITPDNIVAYGIRASLTDGSASGRIGLRGTAKLFGPGTRLGLWVLRKPINLVHQWFQQ